MSITIETIEEPHEPQPVGSDDREVNNLTNPAIGFPRMKIIFEETDQVMGPLDGMLLAIEQVNGLLPVQARRYVIDARLNHPENETDFQAAGIRLATDTFARAAEDMWNREKKTVRPVFGEFEYRGTHENYVDLIRTPEEEAMLRRKQALYNEPAQPLVEQTQSPPSNPLNR